MKPTITLRATYATGRAREFHVEDKRGYCNFSVWDNGPVLSSFGGSVWPGSFPEFFEHFGPDKGCITYRSGYRLNHAGLSAIAHA